MSSVFFLLGKTLGKYQVIEHLGHGGMSEVYLGRQVNLERQVAIKVLHPFLAGEVGFVTRFQREARLVAALRHANIVQVYDFDHNEELDIYYMVMEYITGPTLKARMQNETLAIEESAAIAAAVADALDYAHRREMVHRDVKPANVMFTEEGQPVLADFGIARILSVTGLTASGAMVGTPAYMAPEIGSGKSASASSDIYSLGVLLYEIVAGRQPFEAEVPMGLVMKHINDPVPPPTQFNPAIPPALEAVILKTLAKQPEDRYATAGELAMALRKAVGLEFPVSVGQNQNGRTPTPGRGAAREAVPERDEPLLRTWPELLASPTDQERRARDTKHKHPWFSRAVFSLLIVTLLVLVGLGGWGVVKGNFPPFVHEALSTVVSNGTENSTATPTATPASTPTLTAEPVLALSVPTSIPTPTATLPTACIHRAEVLRVYSSPTDAVVPPGTGVIVYITLRNGGNCSWPLGTRLAFVSGEQLAAPSTLQLEALPVGEQIQVLLPLRAPEELDTYASVWEVQLPDGRTISGQITLAVEVGDLPTVTPTPPVEVTVTPTPVEPLTVAEPVLVTWAVDEQQNRWTGTLALTATGGTGHYRFYYDRVSADHEISDAVLTFRWQECAALPLKIIVTSGEEVTVWDGSIAYPVPEQCEP